jgi:hypothetical protein
MNVETGEVREFDSRTELQKAIATGEWEELRKRPNKNCRKCYGRGHMGFNTSTRKYIVCQCVKLIPDPLMPSEIPILTENSKLQTGNFQ